MTEQPPIMNLADLTLASWGNGAGFEAEVGRIGQMLGTEKLGCTLVVVPPGRKAWPYHRQYANEELFVILAGEGMLRHEGQRYPIKAGDVISGRTGKAHQIVNTSDAELRHLAISTMLHPEIADDPDSGKRMLVAGAPPGRRPYQFAAVIRTGEEVDYWAGEE